MDADCVSPSARITMGGKKKAKEGDGTSAGKKKQVAGQKKHGAPAPVAGGAAMQEDLKYSKMTLKELQEKFLLDGHFSMALHDINVVCCTCLDTHTQSQRLIKTHKHKQTHIHKHTSVLTSTYCPAHMCKCVWVSVCVCMCVCLCV